MCTCILRRKKRSEVNGGFPCYVMLAVTFIFIYVCIFKCFYTKNIASLSMTSRIKLRSSPTFTFINYELLDKFSHFFPSVLLCNMVIVVSRCVVVARFEEMTAVGTRVGTSKFY